MFLIIGLAISLANSVIGNTATKPLISSEISGLILESAIIILFSSKENVFQTKLKVV